MASTKTWCSISAFALLIGVAGLIDWVVDLGPDIRIWGPPFGVLLAHLALHFGSRPAVPGCRRIAIVALCANYPSVLLILIVSLFYSLGWISMR
jgi:hypothetical protein